MDVSASLAVVEVAEDDVPFAGAMLSGLCAAANNADLSSPGPVKAADIPRLKSNPAPDQGNPY